MDDYPLEVLLKLRRCLMIRKSGYRADSPRQLPVDDYNLGRYMGMLDALRVLTELENQYTVNAQRLDMQAEKKNSQSRPCLDS